MRVSFQKHLFKMQRYLHVVESYLNFQGTGTEEKAEL